MTKVYRVQVRKSKKEWVTSTRVFANEQAATEFMQSWYGSTLKFVEWRIVEEIVEFPLKPPRRRPNV